jgi:hypothetical protein
MIFSYIFRWVFTLDVACSIYTKDSTTHHPPEPLVHYDLARYKHIKNRAVKIVALETIQIT